MRQKLKKLIGFILRVAILLGCLLYILWGVDLQAMGRTLLAGDRLALVTILLYPVIIVAVQGFRLRYLVGGTAHYGHCAGAVVVGIGINNMLPARLGEVAKAAYLRKESGVPMTRSLSGVLWERFFDLNAILLMSLAAAYWHREAGVVVPLAAVVVGLWGFLVMDRWFPVLSESLIRLLPWPRLRQFLTEMLEQVHRRFRRDFLLAMIPMTLVVWVVNVMVFPMVLWWWAGLDLDVGQLLIVITVAVLGFAVPSTPGALGVVEATIVLSLGWFGIPKESALAAGIVLRLASTVSPTLMALPVMAVSGFTFREVKKEEAAGGVAAG